MEETVEKETFSPRLYQLEMVRLAKHENLIVKLDTGSGKTFIACLLINHMLPETKASIRDGGKRIIFLVKQVHLVIQQAAAIRRHSYLDDDEIGEYHGQIKPSVDYWNLEKWSEEFESHRILVFTAGVFKDVVNHAKFSLRDANLIIFDECHHTAKLDDFAHICRRLEEIEIAKRPKVLGLTASVVNGNQSESKMKMSVAMLERLMHARVVTSMHQVEEYKRDVREIFAFYDSVVPEKWNIYQQHLQGPLDILRDMYKEMKDRVKHRTCILDPQSSQADMLLKISASDIFFLKETLIEKAKRAVADTLSTLEELGPWAAQTVARVCITDLEGNVVRSLMSDEAGTAMDIALPTLRGFLALLGPLEGLEPRWVSEKVHSLLRVIKGFYLDEENHERNYRGIIFVKQRQTAFVLSTLLQQVGQLDPALRDVIKVEYVTGHGEGSSQAREVRMALNRQSVVLQKFRSGQINLLIATRVVEEGMDVRACNLVLKFDHPEDYRSYIQSRGRARALPSSYIVFIPKHGEGIIQRTKMARYKEMSQVLGTVIESRAVDRSWYEEGNIDMAEDKAEEEITGRKSLFCPHGPDGPRITLHSAMHVLNRYVGQLRHDCLGSPRAHVFIGQIRDGFVGGCVLLPMPCPVRDVIFGPLVKKESRARKWAALVTCERLYEVGALRDDLLPYPKEKRSVVEETGDADDRAEGGKVGSRKRRRMYELPLCEELSEHQQTTVSQWTVPRGVSGWRQWIGQRLHVYQVHVEPSAAQLCDFEDFSLPLVLALLLPSPLSSQDRTRCVASFPLFFVDGVASTSIRRLNEVSLTERDLHVVVSFHETVVGALIGRFSTYFCSDDPQTMLASLAFDLSGSSLPFLVGMINQSTNRLALDEMSVEVANANSGPSFANLPQERWPGSILRARHYASATEHIRERWVVESVSDTTPDSPFNDLSVAATFTDYFRQKYGYNRAPDSNLPMLLVRRLPSIDSTVIFRHYEGDSKRKRRHITHYLMTEACERNPLSVTVWLLVAPLPALLARLNHLLLVRKLHSQVLGFPDHAIPALRHQRMPKAETLTEASEDDEMDLSNLMAAFTLIEVRDFHHLERLEVVGDSFLKFSTSVCLFARCSAKDNEGILTQRRGQLVANANLYRCSRKHALERCLRSRPFELLSNFLPPGFVDRNGNNERWKRKIADKSLADACEAFIGFALLHGSMSEAIKVLDWLGIDPGWERSFEVGFPPPPDALLVTLREEDKMHLLSRLCDGLEKIERKLHYTFKNPELLLQAVTHASCVDNRITDCYQKLEYLGDAVLDFLITKHIFYQEKARNPGELTDLRSALVNNDVFSALVVRAGFHKHLKHADTRLFQRIPQFAESRERVKHNMRTIEFGEDMEEKVTIKILGDLFESLVGAVFLDAQYDLEITWKVVYEIMHDVIDDFSANIPKNPVRLLHERFPGIRFGAVACDSESNLTCLSVTVNGVTYTEQQRNKKMCKIVLARRIMRELQDSDSPSARDS